MNNIQYIAHKLLYSKYKFVLTLFIYLLITFLYNIPNEAFCIEGKNQNNDSIESYNTIKGLTMFAGSIGFILLLQYLTNNPGIDPTVVGDIVCNVPMEITESTPIQNPDIFITNLSEYASIERKGTEKVWVDLAVQKQMRHIDLLKIKELHEACKHNSIEMASLHESMFWCFEYHSYLQNLVNRDFLPYMTWLKTTQPEAYNRIFGVLEGGTK